MNENKIIFPNEIQKEQSIDFILENFKQMKMKKQFFKPFKELPYSIIFHSSLYVKALSMIMIILYFYVIGEIELFIPYPTEKDLSSILMFFAPMLYLIHLIDTSKSFSNNVFELECTLKYKFHQIIGYKFIVLTFISLILNFLLISLNPNINFIDASITVLSSIFIMTSFIYYIVFRFNNPYIPFVLMIIWAFINLSLIYYIPDHFFQTFKITIYLFGTTLALILHIIQFKSIFQKLYKLGGNYA